MKTLYVSDLDGTLLSSKQKTSDYTNKTINQLVEKGMIFSYATARSIHTVKKVTAGLNAKMPLVLYNGTFVIDNQTGKLLISNYFDNSVLDLISDLIAENIYPLVYNMADGNEQFRYIFDKSSSGLKSFIISRKGDKRDTPVSACSDLYCENIFYITCIDDEFKLKKMYEKYKNKYRCIYQKDIYSDNWWLEFMPIGASKSNSVLKLKKLLDCDRIVAFGDGKNDVDLFKIADECYAVENAVDALKHLATGVIDSNDNDGVARWLAENAR